MRKFTIILGSILMNIYLFGQSTMNVHLNDGSVIQIPISDIDSITYTLNNQNSGISLLTLPFERVTDVEAYIGGNVLNDGGTPIVQRGVCYSHNPLPTLADNYTVNGSGLGVFEAHLTGLTPDSVYYARAYATNGVFTMYGNQQVIITRAGTILISSSQGAGVTDSEGHFYSSVVLGNGQEWMAENLRSSFYANGDPIIHMPDSTQWHFTTGNQNGAWVNFNNDSQNDLLFGKLYNGFAIIDTRNVCPTGWHVPTLQELESFVNYLGGFLDAAAHLMKLPGNAWPVPNYYSTNASGFSSKLNGFRSAESLFHPHGSVWWTSTESLNQNFLWTMRLLQYDNSVHISDIQLQNGFSVRCVKD